MRTAGGVVVLDTTVLVYAVGSEHRFRDPCRSLVAAVESGRITATTTPEVIQEFLHVRARRSSRQEAIILAGAFGELLSPLLTVDEDALRGGLGLFVAHARLGAFDAVLCAAGINSGAAALVSADAAFAAVPGVRHVVPDEDGVAELAAAHTPTTPARRHHRRT